LKPLPRRRTSLGCLREVIGVWAHARPTPTYCKTPHCINRCEPAAHQCVQLGWTTAMDLHLFNVSSSPTSHPPHPPPPPGQFMSFACLAAPDRHHVANHRLISGITGLAAADRRWLVGHPPPLRCFRSRPSTTSLQLVNSPGRPMQTAALDRNLLSRQAQRIPVGDISAVNFPHGEANRSARVPSSWCRRPWRKHATTTVSPSLEPSQHT